MIALDEGLHIECFMRGFWGGKGQQMTPWGNVNLELSHERWEVFGKAWDCIRVILK